jgi:hypothetical protein
LKQLAAGGRPDVAAELSALQADAAERRGDSEAARQELARASSLRPDSWEFARRLASAWLAAGRPADARAALETFLFITMNPAEREAAFDLWEKASRAAPARRAGS